jgi:hypothetical protein
VHLWPSKSRAVSISRTLNRVPSLELFPSCHATVVGRFEQLNAATEVGGRKIRAHESQRLESSADRVGGLRLARAFWQAKIPRTRMLHVKRRLHVRRARRYSSCSSSSMTTALAPIAPRTSSRRQRPVSAKVTARIFRRRLNQAWTACVAEHKCAETRRAG